jgi:hypothetical protein
MPLAVGLFFKASAAFYMNDMQTARDAVQEIRQLADKMGDPRWQDITLATRTWLSLISRCWRYIGLG